MTVTDDITTTIRIISHDGGNTGVAEITHIDNVTGQFKTSTVNDQNAINGVLIGALNDILTLGIIYCDQ